MLKIALRWKSTLQVGCTLFIPDRPHQLHSPRLALVAVETGFCKVCGENAATHSRCALCLESCCEAQKLTVEQNCLRCSCARREGHAWVLMPWFAFISNTRKNMQKPDWLCEWPKGISLVCALKSSSNSILCCWPICNASFVPFYPQVTLVSCPPCSWTCFVNFSVTWANQNILSFAEDNTNNLQDPPVHYLCIFPLLYPY